MLAPPCVITRAPVPRPLVFVALVMLVVVNVALLAAFAPITPFR